MRTAANQSRTCQKTPATSRCHKNETTCDGLQGGDANPQQKCTLHIGEHLATAVIRGGVCNDAIHDRP